MLPAGLVLMCSKTTPQWAELVLITTEMTYTYLFVRLTWQYPASLQLVQLNGLKNSHQALWA